MIPDFPHFRPITLNDADTLNTLFAAEQPVISEFTFTNLFVWRHRYGFEISSFGEGLLILAKPSSGEPFFMPPLGIANTVGTVKDAFAYLKSLGVKPVMRRVPKHLAETLGASGFSAVADRDNFDYVYLAQDLAELAGRKYHKKRNLISQFTSRHNYEYMPLTSDFVEECRGLQADWCDIRDCFSPENMSLAEENAAINETLDNFKALSVRGGVILVDGKVEAFSLGEPLNRDTFVIHFEKANPARTGLYQTINQQFCQNIASGFQFINREQDLGEPGLRQAKESYYPTTLIEKFSITEQ